MKFKLAILEKDTEYLNRIVSVFSTKYFDKVEIYGFSEKEVALANLDSRKIDVLIANDAYDIDVSALPKRCSFAYFVESSGIDTCKGLHAICKYQKVELIYKAILSVYSENASSLSALKRGNGSCSLVAFMSPCGGVGTSSVAAASALHYAAKGKSVLYLNLESFGSADSFFKGEGQFDITDVIFALKSKKANLSLKLESCVKRDASGVCFYSASKIALDMMELCTEDILSLLSEIRTMNAYDYIILDMDFGISEREFRILEDACAVVWVSDGSELANTKIERAFNALSILDQDKGTSLIGKLMLMYNRFSNKTGRTLELSELKSVGGAPVFSHAATDRVISLLSEIDVFDKII